MCSTPRSSGSVRKIHHIAINKSQILSNSRMMRRASEIYESRQKEREQRRQRKLQQEKANNMIEDLDSTEVYNSVESDNHSVEMTLLDFIKSKAYKLSGIFQL